MFKTVTLIFAFAAAIVSAQDVAKEAYGTAKMWRIHAYPFPGAYVQKELTSNRVRFLHNAISNAVYKAYTGNSICIKNVDSVQEQKNGFHYKYSVNGCELPKGKLMGYCQGQVACQRSQFEVVVSYSDPPKVTSITRTQ